VTIDQILIVSLVIHGLLLWVIPTISRPGIFFGVTVPPDFRGLDAEFRERVVLGVSGPGPRGADPRGAPAAAMRLSGPPLLYSHRISDSARTTG
jgi:hypothetical protein